MMVCTTAAVTRHVLKDFGVLGGEYVGFFDLVGRFGHLGREVDPVDRDPLGRIGALKRRLSDLSVELLARGPVATGEDEG
jgi:hypothetical protein